jgi:hypothetical protein
MGASMKTAGNMAEKDDKQGAKSEMHRRQRAKNWAMLAALVGLVILFYVIAVVRMGEN